MKLNKLGFSLTHNERAYAHPYFGAYRCVLGGCPLFLILLFTLKTKNMKHFKGKGEHSVKELEQIILEQK